MARLNDLPPATESLESLKRRFIRQNREIARANSIQSARIRTLESEVSRLLTENVALRDEISYLNREVEKCQGSQRFGNQLFSVKEKLEAKLAELSILVTDLGSLPRRAHPITPKESHSSDFLRSPSCCRQNVKPEKTVSTGDEDRLPVICEDKYFPRLTPEVEEIPESPINDQLQEDTLPCSISGSLLSLPANVSSPFFAEKSPESSKCSKVNLLSQNKLPALEPRRKRRDSSFLQDILPNAERFTDPDGYGHIPPRAGSKRKFDVQEEGEPSSAHSNCQDDFQFTRLNASSEDLPQEIDIRSEDQPIQRVFKHKRQPVGGKKPGRRALGPKSTNTNLRSPVKTDSEKVQLRGEGKRHFTQINGTPCSRTIKDERGSFDKLKSSVLEPNLSEFNPKAPIKGARSPKEVGHCLDTNPPVATPNMVDRAATSESADILPEPGPTDGKASANTRTRQSRRSRGPVSYAEPNLRDKMRRPTEELVDAVGEDRFRRISRSQPEHFQTPEEGDTINNNPVQAPQDPPTKLPDHEQMAEGCSAHPDGDYHNGQSASSIAISTLVAGSKKRCQTKKRSETRRYSSNPSLDASHADLTTRTDMYNKTPPAEGMFEFSTEETAAGYAKTPIDSTRLQRGPATRRRSMMV
ncbi:hypothetical protein D8B26_006876 [Coccidioides posadasii str. Silveira]|uniref:Uncharacterized protein n=1 Tax=Coccidioides posadasii (strain RMSCC 757 / Silveira) TaxID=443226 RepID=E9CS66_COCPS|nr:conserved hypothetical protein [Coccidioides posadasii str. Silveira]QVM12243.1 hypothetical protein D8B26_006876 [Coccidioides posadasii str. Silveira]